MKYIIVLVLLLTAACSFVVIDDRPEDVRIATQTARAALIPPLPAGSIRVSLFPTDTPDADLLPTVTPTPECVLVKGNISSDGRKLYHLPGMRNYDQVKIDEVAGEKTWCSEQAAIDAGWTKAGN